MASDDGIRKIRWVDIGAHDTERLKVSGGWLIRHQSSYGGFGLVFVPDPKHERPPEALPE